MRKHINSLVIYYEQDYHPILNVFLYRSGPRIQELLSNAGYSLVFFPNLLESGNFHHPSLTSNFRYFQPEYPQAELQNLSFGAKVMSSPYFIQEIYRGLRKELGNVIYPQAGFIILDKQGNCRTLDFADKAKEVADQPDSIESLEKEVIHKLTEYIAASTDLTLISFDEPVPDEPEQLFTIPQKSIAYNRTYSDPEEAFIRENKRVELEIKEELKLRLEGENMAVVLDLLVKVMRHVKQENPEMASQLERLMNIHLDTGADKLSHLKLEVTHGGYDYQILLPDYDLKIEMSKLPKSLYLLFLRHPEGVFLHDLTDHREELLSIYSRIANLTDAAVLKDNIDRLVDMTDNSVHVNFARIKKSFLLKLTDRLAKNYYVTGKRGKVKKILLPPNLLDIDPALAAI